MIKGENTMESFWSSFFIVFENGIWVGYFETAKEDGEGYRAARYVFGPEPGEGEIREFILQNGALRLHWTTATSVPPLAVSKSPKRRSREAARAVQDPSGASKARNAVKADMARHKGERRTRRKQRIEQEQERRFVQRQEKRKSKHRGR
jgi:hypothetical protein